MIIIWASVIALSLIIEFATCEIVSIWFAPAALPPLIMAPFDIAWHWQTLTFLLLAIAFIITCRPTFKRWLIKKTVPTNIDANFGKHARLTAPVVDGLSSVKINGVTWVAKIVDGNAAQGDMVEILKTESNKFLVKPVINDVM